jgi:hypothetical protein
MTGDSATPAPSPRASPAKPKRPRRSPYQSMVDEIMAEEEAWKAEQEAAKIAAGEPPPPHVEKWKLPIHREYDEWGFPMWPKDRRRTTD